MKIQKEESESQRKGKIILCRLGIDFTKISQNPKEITAYSVGRNIFPAYQAHSELSVHA